MRFTTGSKYHGSKNLAPRAYAAAATARKSGAAVGAPIISTDCPGWMFAPNSTISLAYRASSASSTVAQTTPSDRFAYAPVRQHEPAAPLIRSREAGKESNVSPCPESGVEGPARRRRHPPDALPHRARGDRAQRGPRDGRARRHPHARRAARPAAAPPDRRALRRRDRARPARHHLLPRRRARARRTGAAPPAT